MSKKILCLFLALLLLLSACAHQSGSESSELFVYRLSHENTGPRLIRERLEYGERDSAIETVVHALNSQPSASTVMSRVFPAGVELDEVRVEKGKASVRMSGDYASLSAGEKLLCEAAIVLSLSTLDEVCVVDIFCGSVAYGSGLKAEDFWLGDGLSANVPRSAKLYLPEADSTKLSTASVSVVESGERSLAAEICEELLSRLGGGMEDAEIISCLVEDGLCSLDISEEFYGAEPTEAYEGMRLIYSIVNSLCRLPGIDAVSISVEGYPVESYGGFRCMWPLGMNESIVSY